MAPTVASAFVNPATPVVPENDILMTVEDVAGYLQVTTKCIYNMVADNRLPAVRLGRNLIRLRKSDVDAALKPVCSRD
jgi:excisionase family DNA binding protein